MLSKSQISFVRSLQLKKFRREYNLFVVEGIKSVIEFIHSDYFIDAIFCTADALPKLGKLSNKIKLIEAAVPDLHKLSSLTSPQEAIALVQIPLQTAAKPESFADAFTLVLDSIQDPGNLGTIIRTADWFGFTQLVCSNNTVDAYNSKVVQASMGSLSRIEVYYTDLENFLKDFQGKVYGALLDGESIYETKFATRGLLVLGNEGNGISPEVQKLITHAVTIPAFGKAESLNVAISAAIFCSELKRNTK
ncbi:MAG: aviRb [Sphingobacteriaceae bacterium]|jgi:TrmH family RNA methyltransferase|nr:aviRb [Sphingobacteriaceae bacterium]